MRWVIGLAAVAVLTACGDTGPSQTQQGNTYIKAFQTQGDKVLGLRNQVANTCSAGDQNGCIHAIIGMANAATAAKGALPAPPACMNAANLKARAGFTQIEQAGSAGIDALAADSPEQVKVTSDAVNAGADELVAAATDLGNAKC